MADALRRDSSSSEQDLRPSEKSRPASIAARLRTALRRAIESLWRAAVPPSPDRPDPRRAQFPSLESARAELLRIATHADSEPPAPAPIDRPTTEDLFPKSPATRPAPRRLYVGH